VVCSHAPAVRIWWPKTVFKEGTADLDSWAAPGLDEAEASGKAADLTINLPLSPDDWFSGTGSGESLTTNLQKSLADQAARNYAIAVNSLRYGHAHGRAIVGDPWRLPTRPLSPIYIREGGLVAAFRVNGTSWAISNRGLAVGTDALFCGAVAQEVAS
jgi:hypothetical protein